MDAPSTKNCWWWTDEQIEIRTKLLTQQRNELNHIQAFISSTEQKIDILQTQLKSMVDSHGNNLFTFCASDLQYGCQLIKNILKQLERTQHRLVNVKSLCINDKEFCISANKLFNRCQLTTEQIQTMLTMIENLQRECDLLQSLERISNRMDAAVQVLQKTNFKDPQNLVNMYREAAQIFCDITQSDGSEDSKQRARKVYQRCVYYVNFVPRFERPGLV